MSTLASAKLVFLDVETTGLTPAGGDRVIELALIACTGRRRRQEAEWLVSPGRSVPAEVTAVHGITDAKLRQAPPFERIAPRVARLLDRAWLVGHNVRFDAGFVAHELARVGIHIRPAGLLDTCQLAALAWRLPNYQLATVAQHLGISPGRAHRALDDTRTTRAAFHRILDALHLKHNAHLRQVCNAQPMPVTWPNKRALSLPPHVYDALTTGRYLAILPDDERPEGTKPRWVRPIAVHALNGQTRIHAIGHHNRILSIPADRLVPTDDQ